MHRRIFQFFVVFVAWIACPGIANSLETNLFEATQFAVWSCTNQSGQDSPEIAPTPGKQVEQVFKGEQGEFPYLLYVPAEFNDQPERK